MCNNYTATPFISVRVSSHQSFVRIHFSNLRLILIYAIMRGYARVGGNSWQLVYCGDARLPLRNRRSVLAINLIWSPALEEKRHDRLDLRYGKSLLIPFGTWHLNAFNAVVEELLLTVGMWGRYARVILWLTRWNYPQEVLLCNLDVIVGDGNFQYLHLSTSLQKLNAFVRKKDSFQIGEDSWVNTQITYFSIIKEGIFLLINNGH